MNAVTKPIHLLFLFSFFNNFFKANSCVARICTAACMLFVNTQFLFAQTTRLAVVGSSTAAGTGATVPDSGWVGLLSQYYKCRLGTIDSLANLGVAGSNFYNAMPSSYVPPPSRPTPDNIHNVTKALTFLNGAANADEGVVIVNFPTNNYNSYSIAEIMNGLQIIYDSVTAANRRCYITTTQPRCDASFNNSEIKKKLADIKDSILIRFGNNVINFWDGLYNIADTCTLPQYASGDLIHFNNQGHRVLFERVLAKNIFNLPVWYSKATGLLDNPNTWGKNTDGSGAHPQSFAIDNQTFYVVNNPAPTIGANWILSGKNTRLIIGDGVAPVNFTIPPGIGITITAPAVTGCN